MTVVHVRPATLEDMDALRCGMRAEDADEVYAAAGPLSAHEFRQRVSGALAAVDDEGRVICLFGCAALPRHDTIGVPWMLGTNRLDQHLLSMCKQARQYVAEWLTQYETLTNATAADNHTVIAWLRWLGFTVGTRTFQAPHDPEMSFIQFSKERLCATRSPSRH